MVDGNVFNSILFRSFFITGRDDGISDGRNLYSTLFHRDEWNALHNQMDVHVNSAQKFEALNHNYRRNRDVSDRRKIEILLEKVLRNFVNY